MLRYCLKLIFPLILSLFLNPQPLKAFYNPQEVPNNQYGIHLADTNDLPEVATLVNSQGGDWGYVTVVMQENDRSLGKWQGLFNQMRRNHLIPLVRLATRPQEDYWLKPTPESAKDWANFLNQLNWPVENRYVIIFNEPNHAKEWGNNLDPAGYAKLLRIFAEELKKASEDFFILPAGLDASAASDGIALDEATFLEEMLSAEPDLFKLIDGWTSHAYPNPGFSGAPYAWGRGTLHTYQWELSYLRNLGLNKNLPVFITETGWQHSYGKSYNFRLLSPEVVAGYFTVAGSIWSDPQIIAVTPFIFNYQDYPFDHFSFRRLASNDFYTHYYAYQNLPKKAGFPLQKELYVLKSPLVPGQLVTGSTYTLKTTLENQGQGILDPDEYKIEFSAVKGLFQAVSDPLVYTEPGESSSLIMHLMTPDQAGQYSYSLYFKHKDRQLVIQEGVLTLVPPPAISLSVKLGWRKTSTTHEATVLVYDEEDLLLHKFPNVMIENGRAKLEGLRDIVPGNQYRVVIVVPNYLPRQVILPLSSTLTEVVVKRMLPLDFNGDGRLSLADLTTMLRTPPRKILPLIFGP